MTIKKIPSDAAAAKARGAAALSVGSARRVSPANGNAPRAAKDEGTCEGALMHVIRLAQTTRNGVAAASAIPDEAGDAAPGPDAVSADREPVENEPNAAGASLQRALDGLDSEVVLKLRTLMIAGRDGKNIGDVNVNLAPQDSTTALAVTAADSSQSGPLLADYLRRGHAIACAAAVDLERPLASWSGTSHTLDERAWLSFGKQLAKAELDDWQCLAFVDGNQTVSRLYLRLQGQAWWSFQAVLDRPSAAVVEKHERTLSSRRTKGLSTRSLSSLAARLSSTEGRALRRAARAIRARVGEATAP